jgi:hypothetical protein
VFGCADRFAQSMLIKGGEISEKARRLALQFGVLLVLLSSEFSCKGEARVTCSGCRNFRVVCYRNGLRQESLPLP